MNDNYLQLPLAKQPASREEYLALWEKTGPLQIKMISMESSGAMAVKHPHVQGNPGGDPFLIEEEPRPWQITQSDTHIHCYFEGGADFVCHDQVQQSLGRV